MYAIQLSDVSVYKEKTCILNNINLNISEGQFLGIIGPNGGGKTTLLKVILGLIKPQEGYVKVFNKKMDTNDRLIGYVPQFLSFDKNFPINVHDVILMGRLKVGKSLFHKYKEHDFKAVNKIMKRLNIYKYKHRQISQLSGGQLQKVMIARALAVNPKILILDEPTASLDSNSKSSIYSILKELNKQITIIAVTHDLSFVSSYIDSIACLNKDLFYHGKVELSENIVEKVYGCPIDLIAHGVPHRVLRSHEECKNA